MLKPSFSRQFQKDLKKIQKSRKKTDKIKPVIKKLIDQESLEDRYRDHKLVGNYRGRRECHVEPDWLLIYKVDSKEIIFERTGSHSDLFK